jgi:hypothetical protein
VSSAKKESAFEVRLREGSAHKKLQQMNRTRNGINNLDSNSNTINTSITITNIFNILITSTIITSGTTIISSSSSSSSSI